MWARFLLGLAGGALLHGDEHALGDHPLGIDGADDAVAEAHLLASIELRSDARISHADGPAEVRRLHELLLRLHGDLNRLEIAREGRVIHVVW